MRPSLLLPLVASATMLGCLELSLGDSPFYCNNGDPPCPEGYACVKNGSGRSVCRKEGLPPPADAKVVKKDGPVTKKDGVSSPDLWVQKDMSVADLPPLWPDHYLPPPDQYIPPPDKNVPKPDVPKLGCQNNLECKTKDPSNPCCCLLLLVWVCAPACLNPFCF